MKKIMISIIAAVAMSTAVSQQALGQQEASLSTEQIVVTPTGYQDDEYTAMTALQRLEEINGMDKSNLSFSEKRELRKEVKGIKQTLEETSGGIYLSVGALIIIVLLLIIFL